jgi:hypothetical protein
MLSHHSLRMPSLMPHMRVPVNVNFFIIWLKRLLSMDLTHPSALLASWMGPPKRENLCGDKLGAEEIEG